MSVFTGNDPCLNDSVEVEVLDSGAEAWRVCTQPSTPRHSHTCSAMGGLLWVCGGLDEGVMDGEECPLDSVEVFDPQTEQWSAGPSLMHARSGHECVVVGGKLVVCGGSGSEE